MKTLIGAVALLSTFATSAFAADYAAAPADVWSGYYVGLQGGYAWGEGESPNSVFGDPEIEGGLGGLYYGRNWQSGSWVFGLDGSLSISDITDGVEYNPGEVGNVTVEGFSATRLRVGYAFDNVMAYAAAGFSLARAEVDVNGNFNDAHWLKGFTVGGGLEAKLAEQWSARVEYLYVDYGEETFEAGEGPFELEEKLHVVRAGIAYHF